MKLLFASRWGFLLMLVSTLLGLSGCAHDSENIRDRPWSAPQSWENGLPSTMREGR